MIKIQARGSQAAEIRIFGPIGEDWLGNGTTAETFDRDLKALGDIREITVRLNSNGGLVFDAVAIYNALKAHPARVTVSIEGIAASSASLIAMAGDVVKMGTATQIMIHSPWQLAMGNADALRKSAEVLDQVENGMIDAYAERTGLGRAEIKRMLDTETWLSPSDAIAKGFADEMLESTEAAAMAGLDLSRFRNVPQQVLAMTTATVPADASAILAAETERRRKIRDSFSPFADKHRTLLDACLDDPRCSVDAARDKLLAAVGEGAEPLAGPGVIAAAANIGDFRTAAVDALCIRAGVQLEKPHAAARDLRHTSVVELARMCLSQAGRTHRDMNPSKLIKAALSTSDFPGILENALGKALRNGYESDPQSHKAWVHATQVPDFKTASRLLLGSAPDLQAIPELGEYKYGSPSENKATLAVSKYGRALRLSWEMLINDDLGAFIGVASSMGAAGRRKEADDVYALFTANSGAGQTMQDTVALFHSSHANLTSGAGNVGAISVGTLGAARTLLRKQTAIGNGGYLNLNPRFLIVPAESETLAEQVLASASRQIVGASTDSRRTDSPTPEWISKLQLVVEPRLNSTYGFYVAAHWSQIDTCELATLQADGGEPVIEEEQEFNVDARNYKVRHVFVAKFIDWKGIVRVPVS